MTHSDTIRAASRCLPLALALTFATAGAALAQAPFGNNSGAPAGPVVPTAKPDKPKEAPPPALPGASSGGDRTAQPDRPPSDLSPTDALFDAINRGDMASARDAINRGADLNGRNILGMSPTELSVDLGRNDITFLLLSLRTPGPDTPPPRTATASAKPGRVGKTATAAAVRQDRQAQGASRLASTDADAGPSPGFATTARRPSAGAPAPQPAAATLAPVASGGTGTPIPQMGFLGFGGAQR